MNWTKILSAQQLQSNRESRPQFLVVPFSGFVTLRFFLSFFLFLSFFHLIRINRWVKENRRVLVVQLSKLYISKSHSRKKHFIDKLFFNNEEELTWIFVLCLPVYIRPKFWTLGNHSPRNYLLLSPPLQLLFVWIWWKIIVLTVNWYRIPSKIIYLLSCWSHLTLLIKDPIL